MVTLIERGVARTGGTWAELGAGTGNFTRALAELLGAQATIYAVDRSTRALAGLAASGSPGARIVPVASDFTRPLDLPPLDGILMANALHFVPAQSAVLQRLATHLRPDGRLLLVEYNVRDVLRYVPFPVPFERLEVLAGQAGLPAPALVGTRRSRSTGIEMYAAVAILHAAAPPPP